MSKISSAAAASAGRADGAGQEQKKCWKCMYFSGEGNKKTHTFFQIFLPGGSPGVLFILCFQCRDSFFPPLAYRIYSLCYQI